jgi:uncharacterized protein (DUF169 family)
MRRLSLRRVNSGKVYCPRKNRKIIETQWQKGGTIMESKIVAALKLAYSPVAILWSDEKPQDALGFKEGKWGCVMWMLASAAKGKTAAFDEKTYGCWGGGVGLGFGNRYLDFPGGIDGFYRFLSTGNDQSEQGRQVAAKIEPFVDKTFLEDFLHGEGYMHSPERVKEFVDCMPIMQVPTKYVLFKPLEKVDAMQEKPEVIVFLADPDQLSALVILSNYRRSGNENAFIPYAAGCQTIGVYPYREAGSDNPRAVIGLTDISARNNLKKMLGRTLLTFAVPLKMFYELEENIEGSFLQKNTWRSLME